MAWAANIHQLEVGDAIDAEPRKRRILVLEGGGLRGAFTAGVLEEFCRRGVHFDRIYATSAGAPSAAYSIAGQIEDAIHIWEHRTHGSQLVSPAHLFKKRTLMDIEGLIDLFRDEIPLATEALDNAKTQMFVAVTNCITGRAEHIRISSRNALPLLNATMALPFAYGRVIRIDGMPYIDGGLADAIPLQPALANPEDEVTVVLTRPSGYRKRRQRSAEAAFRVSYRRYPALWPVFDRRYSNYNDQLAQLEEMESQGVLSVIRPPVRLPASRMTRERDKIVDTVSIGRAAARQWHTGRESAAGREAAASVKPIGR